MMSLLFDVDRLAEDLPRLGLAPVPAEALRDHLAERRVALRREGGAEGHEVVAAPLHLCDEGDSPLLLRRRELLEPWRAGRGDVELAHDALDGPSGPEEELARPREERRLRPVGRGGARASE